MLRIGSRQIGPEEPCYLIAEFSGNHGQDYSKAVEMIHVAAEAGADAVKLQTYTPDTLTIDCDRDEFLIGPGTIWQGRKLYELYGQAYTPWDWQPKLKAIADGLGMDLFSTPFDTSALEFLEQMEVPAHKVASFELVDLPLIRRIAQKGKPMIVSTGMASLEEIQQAVDAVRGEGNDQLALLKCTSAYPARPEEMNLRCIPELARRFDVPAGLSDHTLDPVVPVTAVALGACIVEKHFTLRRQDGGPDAAFSLEPAEFSDMVGRIRSAEAAMGVARFDLTESEEASRVFRRSLFVVRDVEAGEVFTDENVRSIRPGYGLPPRQLDRVLGRRACVSIARGTPLSWDLVAPGEP
jgi:N-acetylneuraminate synthase